MIVIHQGLADVKHRKPDVNRFIEFYNLIIERNRGQVFIVGRSMFEDRLVNEFLDSVL